MKTGELPSNTHKIAQDYYSKLLEAEKELIAQKKNLVNEKFKILQGKKNTINKEK